MTDRMQKSAPARIRAAKNTGFISWAILAVLACGMWLLPAGAMAETAAPDSVSDSTQSKHEAASHEHSCPGMAEKNGDHAMKDGHQCCKDMADKSGHQCCQGGEGTNSCKAEPEKQSGGQDRPILAQAAPAATQQKSETGKSEPEMDHSKMDHSKMDHSKMGHSGHHHHKMVLDDDGMVMNWNDDTPSRDCAKISGDVAFEVHAGRKYAKQGQSYGYSQNEWSVPPCSRVTITFVNEDNIRHQWMMHGLPRYLYPQGMFHLAAAGGTTRKGTFIVPSGDNTYLVHCDMAQHMEKGLKGQLKVGNGSGDLPSVPGITDARVHDPQRQNSDTWQLVLLASGLMLAVGAGIGGGWIGRKPK